MIFKGPFQSKLFYDSIFQLHSRFEMYHSNFENMQKQKTAESLPTINTEISEKQFWVNSIHVPKAFFHQLDNFR